MLALIIDDDPFMRSLLQAHCKTLENVQTSTATNGQEGLEAISKQQPDIIFCDLNMPVMDGFTLWQTLRAEEATRTIHFVLISSDVRHDGTIKANRDKIERINNDHFAQILSKDSITRQRVAEIHETVHRKS